MRRPGLHVLTAAALMLLVPASVALAGSPSGDRLGDMQELDVEASPPVAGAGIIYDFQQTYWNEFGLASLRSPIAVVIHFPRGTVWNGSLFPQCDPVALAARGPSACPPGAKFATAQVVAAIGSQAVTTTARVTDFVGTTLGGRPTQLLYVVPQLGPPFVLTGVIRDERSGPYGLAVAVDLRKLPGGTPSAPSPIVIISIHNVDIHTSVIRAIRGRRVHTPLIVAPPTCDGFWHYAFDSVYPTGPPLTSTSVQPCVQTSGDLGSRARHVGPRTRHTRHRRPHSPG